MTIIFQSAKPYIKHKEYNLLYKHKNNPIKNKRSFNVLYDILSVPSGTINPDWDIKTKDFYVRKL